MSANISKQRVTSVGKTSIGCAVASFKSQQTSTNQQNQQQKTSGKLPPSFKKSQGPSFFGLKTDFPRKIDSLLTALGASPAPAPPAPSLPPAAAPSFGAAPAPPEAKSIDQRIDVLQQKMLGGFGDEALSLFFFLGVVFFLETF